MKKQTLNTLAALLMLCAGTLAADEVIFKSGLTQQGRVEPVFGTPSKISLTTSSGRIEINRSLIQRIIEHEDEVDFTLIGDQYYAAGAFELAIEQYQLALQANSGYNDAQQGLDKSRQAITNRRGQQVLQVQQENRTLLQQTEELIVAQDFQKAEKNLLDLEGRNPTDEQKAEIRRIRKNLFLEWGLERMDKLDRGGAEVYFTKVLDLEPNNPRAKEALLTIWEKNPNKRAEVAAAYEEKLKETPLDISLNQNLADLYLAMNQPEKAIEPLKKLVDTPTFQTRGYDKRLMDAFVEVSYQQSSIGKIDEAIATLRDLQEIFPRVDRSQLQLLEYRKAANELASDDYNGQAALLPTLVEQGLESMAVSEAERILREDPTNENAMRIFRRYAENELKEINALFSERQYIMSANLASLYGDKYATRFPDLVQEAADLYNKAQLEAAKEQKQKREQARDIVNTSDQYSAEARRNVELYKSADNANRSSIISYKNEAIRFNERAIQGYKTALQIDPSLGPLVGGMDVNTKLDESERLQRSLTREPIRVFRPQRRSNYNN
ncbi:MAG: tetratricopeptide repeat protein [Sumerlaeia bacterium]